MEEKCQAIYYGKCRGHLNKRDVVYHCRPRSKDLTRGHGTFDESKQVVLCDGHFKRIAEDYEGKLPELYSWDFDDALDGLTCRLEYTGYNPVDCGHCNYIMKDTGTETGACHQTCKHLTELGAKWDHCTCNKPVTCVCDSYKNNQLHWAILTYGNGFERDYYCEACIRPCWRDSYENYNAGLVDEATILKIAKENPGFIYRKNAHGTTPMQLIHQLIELLLYTREDEYVKYVEYRLAGSNIATLEKIAKKLKGGSASP